MFSFIKTLFTKLFTTKPKFCPKCFKSYPQKDRKICLKCEWKGNDKIDIYN